MTRLLEAVLQPDERHMRFSANDSRVTGTRLSDSRIDTDDGVGRCKVGRALIGRDSGRQLGQHCRQTAVVFDMVVGFGAGGIGYNDTTDQLMCTLTSRTVYCCAWQTRTSQRSMARCVG